MTVRQVFYACVVRELVPNNKSAYRKVQRLLNILRDEGEIEEEHIVDRSRQVHTPAMWSDPADYVDPSGYRKNMWATQSNRVEVWCEKEALTGIIEPVATEMAVTFVPGHGFSSRTMIAQAAQRIDEAADTGKPTTIYYLGDFDPSGVDMDRDIQSRLELLFGIEFGKSTTFRRLAILKGDIVDFDLPPQRVKEADTRTPGFEALHGPNTVELDALPADELRRRISQAIRSHIDDDAWERTSRIEEAERESLEKYRQALAGSKLF